MRDRLALPYLESCHGNVIASLRKPRCEGVDARGYLCVRSARWNTCWREILKRSLAKGKPAYDTPSSWQR